MNTNLMDERAELLQRYRKLRSTMRELHSELLTSLSKETVTRCGKKLGFMVDGTLVFESEDESSVLMDYCLYQGWSGQHNAFSRFLAKQTLRSRLRRDGTVGGDVACPLLLVAGGEHDEGRWRELPRLAAE